MRKGFLIIFLLFSLAWQQSYSTLCSRFKRNGQRTLRDRFRAWKGLADSGEAEAQNNLGFLYQHGHGAKQSYTKAIRFYEMASDQGLPEATHNLGMLYFQGYGVPQNYDQAKRFFMKAAEKSWRP